MKLSFSTVGCPDWSFSGVLAAAKDLGYNGIELRGLGEELYMPGHQLFAPSEIENTAKSIRDLGLEVSCVASDIALFESEANWEGAAEAYIHMAHALSCPYVRVLGDAWGQPGVNVREDLVQERLKALAPKAQAKGVTLLLETNGIYADTRRVKALMESIDHPNVAVLWDINHPVRYFNESVASTWANIGRYVRHVHIKDSATLPDGKLSYKIIGKGTLPLCDCLRVLKSAGYTGYLSLEWIKRWNRELEDADVVFAYYVYEMKRLWNHA